MRGQRHRRDATSLRCWHFHCAQVICEACSLCISSSQVLYFSQSRGGVRMFSPATKQSGYFAWAAFLFLCMCAVAASLPATNLLPENPVVLNMLWRISFGPDYAETNERAEMLRNSPSGIIYYVPAAPNNPQSAQMQPVYRLFTPHIPDHMPSIKKGEGGYNTEGILGYAWVNPN